METPPRNALWKIPASDTMIAAPNPTNAPEAPRPIASLNQEKATRPQKPPVAIKIIMNDACCGVVFSTSTNRVGTQRLMP